MLSPIITDDIVDSNLSRQRKVKLREIVVTFLFIGVTSVGGGLTAYIRRIIVDNKAWLTDEEFFPGLALCQLLPGANVVGLSLYIGNHLCGIPGAVIATICLIAPSASILFGLGYLYFSLGSLPAINSLLIGVAAVACGLMASMCVESAKASIRNRFDFMMFLITFFLVKFAHVHVPLAILIMTPIAIWWYRPKKQKDKKSPRFPLSLHQ